MNKDISDHNHTEVDDLSLISPRVVVSAERIHCEILKILTEIYTKEDISGLLDKVVHIITELPDVEEDMRKDVSIRKLLKKYEKETNEKQ